MRQIGEKNKFAIQYEVTEVVEQYVYGHICYWINGIQIGNFALTTIISDVLIFLPQIVKDNGNREHKKFFEMEKEKVCYFLGGQAYLDDEKYEELALKEMWARFNIGLILDAFNGVIIKLIDSQQKSRIIFTHNKEIYEFYLDKGIVDEVFCCFYEEFDSFCKEHILE